MLSTPRRMSRLTIALVVIITAAAGVITTTEPRVQPRLTPLAMVERAAAALGGRDAIVALPGVRISVRGSGLSPSAAQARDPRASHNLVVLEKEYLVDFVGARGRRESSQMSPGAIRFYTRAVATTDGARTVDLLKWRSGTDIQNQSPEVGKAALAVFARLTPHGTIRQALQSASTLADAGQVERDGRKLDAVTYTDPVGATVTVLLETTTGLPFSVSPGEAPNSTYEYGDYARVGAFLVPQRLTSRSAFLTEELRVTTLDLNPAFTAQDFELPAGYSDPPPLGETRAVRVADGVYRLDGMPGNVHTAFVVDGSDVSVFDAPQSPQWSDITLKLIRETVGEHARVVRVLVSHHHGDHTAGLPPYVTAGAAIVSGLGNEEFLRARLPEAQRAEARFESVDGARTFGSGPNRIEAHVVPNEHADATVVYFIPGARVLLQGDLFYIPERGPVPPAFAVTADLARIIDAKQLDVRTIIGVHGRQGTMEELRQSLDLRSGLR